MGNKLLLFSLLCCIGSHFQNKSAIQESDPILSTNYNGQTIYDEQSLQKNYEEQSLQEKYKEQTLQKNYEDQILQEYYEDQTLQKNYEEQTLQQNYAEPALQEKCAEKVYWGQNFGASFDFKLYQNIVLIFHVLWVIKIVARFVC